MNPSNYISQLPDRLTLKKICKGQAVLDWVVCGQEFETYHRYFKANQEEYEGSEAQIGVNFEDEQGASLHLYFTENACIIVPSQCITNQTPDNASFEKKIPKEFRAFYKKHFENEDVPFVIFSKENENWQLIENFSTEEIIHNFEHLNTNAEFYKEWALDFFGDETFFLPDADLQTIESIYQGKVLTEKMVLSIVEDVEDWSDLEHALNDMPYRFDF